MNGLLVFVRSMLLLTRVRAGLRRTGLRPMVQRARRRPLGRARRDRDAVTFARSLATQVERAAACFPGRARCLEQSIALLMLLRDAGVAAELRLGIIALPFTAHAWVEVNGQAINADSETLATMQPFPELRG
jgi:transglutaminase-like putative cysteine protease